MIVVPALTHRKESQQPIIARIITRHIPLAAVSMREGIDAKGCVVQNNSAPKEANDKSRPAVEQEANCSDYDRWQILEFMKQPQFKIRRKVRDLRQICRIMLPIKNPANVTVYEALVTGRVHISLSVRVQMMVSMFCSPPKNAFLSATLRNERNNELEDSAC